jgi:hypothetical protein
MPRAYGPHRVPRVVDPEDLPLLLERCLELNQEGFVAPTKGSRRRELTRDVLFERLPRARLDSACRKR